VRAGYGACFIPNSFHADGVTVVAVSDVELRRRIGLEWTEAPPPGSLRYSTPIDQQPASAGTR
jgi:hypothetical protein